MLGFGKKLFLGIDIGVSSIKIVEIKISDNKPVLSNYAWVNTGDDKTETQEDYFKDALVKNLKKLLADGGFKGRDVYAAIPSVGGLVTLIEFPEMNRDDLDQAIRFEAHKYIPTSLEDVVISWDVLSRKILHTSLVRKNDVVKTIADEAMKPKEAKLQVLLVAAPKNKVANYERLIKDVGLNLNSIEIESFSIVRSLVGNDPGNFVVVDIGARICNIILVEKGTIKVNRNIDAGGRDITKSIARSMNINEERAEKLKFSERDIAGKDMVMHLPALEIILAEIKRVLNAYYKNEGEQKVDGVILSGGSSGLPGIDAYFSEALKIKTIIGDPFSRIEYDKKLEPKLKDVKARFTVSIGLALRGLEEHLKK